MSKCDTLTERFYTFPTITIVNTMAQSRLGNVWKKLRESEDITKQLVDDLQEWAQDEEVQKSIQCI